MFERASRVLLVVLAAFVTFVAPVQRADAVAQGAPPTSFIVVDADTGTVLVAGNEHEAVPPASTSKLMTALTAVERVPMDGVVEVSALAAAQPASRVAMVQGDTWPFQDALASLLIVSANDAAYAIAETVSGSLEDFAAAEAETGRRYGMLDSTFADPAGLDDEASFGGGPRMSVYDIAIAGRNALAVPQIRLFSALREYEFVDPTGAQRSLVNHNKFLPGATNGYEGANGLKTGYTDNAGRTFVASATRNGRTLIAVVIGTYDIYGWAGHYLDAGFATPPDTAGTGDRLPPVRVSPYDQRMSDREGFLSLTDTVQPLPLAGGTTTTAAEGGAAVGATSTPTTAGAQGDDGDAGSEDGASVAASGPDTTAAPAATTTDASDSGDEWFSLRNVAIAVGALLVVLFLLRRRAVRRRRRRRAAQRRAVAAAMRRGSLPVVDGRYRTGTRLGPPVESHVKIHPAERPPGTTQR